MFGSYAWETEVRSRLRELRVEAERERLARRVGGRSARWPAELRGWVGEKLIHLGQALASPPTGAPPPREITPRAGGALSG